MTKSRSKRPTITLTMRHTGLAQAYPHDIRRLLKFALKACNLTAVSLHDQELEQQHDTLILD